MLRPPFRLARGQQEDAYFVSKRAMSAWIYNGLRKDKIKVIVKPFRDTRNTAAVDQIEETTAVASNEATPIEAANASCPPIPIDREASVDDRLRLIDNTDILCLHGKVDPFKVEQAKIISQVRLC